MFIHKHRVWDAASKRITPERAYLNRREFVAAMGAVSIGAIGSAVAGNAMRPGSQYRLDRPLTDEAAMGGNYGPFVEFSADRALAHQRARAARPSRSIQIAGLVRRRITVDLDDLLRRFALDERACRFRCVEGWAMVIPWTGFAMRDFIDWCRPATAAKYVRFISTYDPERMPGIAEQPWHRWPYAEALTIAEAANELTFLATGTYGHHLRSEQGAPLRLVVPWKYGHKSIKGIARIEFVAERPATFWNSALPHEYPFDADVDPSIPHPRWSQQYETMIGTGERTKTQLYNGYGEFVGELYR